MFRPILITCQKRNFHAPADTLFFAHYTFALLMLLDLESVFFAINNHPTKEGNNEHVERLMCAFRALLAHQSEYLVCPQLPSIQKAVS
jgi:hypothetical protein